MQIARSGRILSMMGEVLGDTLERQRHLQITKQLAQNAIGPRNARRPK